MKVIEHKDDGSKNIISDKSISKPKEIVFKSYKPPTQHTKNNKPHVPPKVQFSKIDISLIQEKINKLKQQGLAYKSEPKANEGWVIFDSVTPTYTCKTKELKELDSSWEYTHTYDWTLTNF